MVIFQYLSPVPIRFQGQLSQKLLRVVQESPPGKTLMQCGVEYIVDVFPVVGSLPGFLQFFMNYPVEG